MANVICENKASPKIDGKYLLRSHDNNFPELYKRLFVIEIQSKFFLTES